MKMRASMMFDEEFQDQILDTNIDEGIQSARNRGALSTRESMIHKNKLKESI